MQVVREQPQLVFVDVPFHTEATEPERIAVDHVVKTGAGSGSGAARPPRRCARTWVTCTAAWAC